jgi:POT family proton-dependent oligopeptide transporter
MVGKSVQSSGPMKFGLGMTLLGLGFDLATEVWVLIQNQLYVSMFLIAAYLFHTLGVVYFSCRFILSKLVPATWIGIMFGVYYLFIGMGNKKN